jgi:hypothetical protein
VDRDFAGAFSPETYAVTKANAALGSLIRNMLGKVQQQLAVPLKVVKIRRLAAVFSTKSNGGPVPLASGGHYQ